ncbi:MAG TPA: hypothetical protein PKZ62_07505 [Thermoclostridium caenicola]|nr:hypothetical protein [Thermoclostridium caenicola]
MNVFRELKKYFKTGGGMSQWFYSIRTRLLAAVLFMIIPIVFLGLFSYNRAFKSIRQTAEESTFQIIEQVGKYLQLSYSGVEADCNQIIMNTNFIKYVTAKEDDANLQMNLTEFMSSIKLENALIDDIILLLEGKKTCIGLLQEGGKGSPGKHKGWATVQPGKGEGRLCLLGRIPL